MENFILFGELADTLALDPTVKQGGTKIDNSDRSLNIFEPGGGICYYFMPINIYLSGSITTPKWQYKDEQVKFTSDFGLGFNIAVGKEWYVSENWGLGVAFLMHFSRVKTDLSDLGGTQKFTTNNLYFGIAFSATYN